MKMLSHQRQLKATQGESNDQQNNDISPTAEFIEEPSLIGKRESQNVTGEKEGPPRGGAVVQNIRIADMLKHQS